MILGLGPVALAAILRSLAEQLRLLVTPMPAQEVAHRIGELYLTSADVLASDELMSLLEPMLRADFQLCERYKPTTRRPPTRQSQLFACRPRFRRQLLDCCSK